MIGAKMYLGIIRKQLSNQLDKEVSNYKILLNVKNKRLKFIIDGKEYDFKDTSMMQTIEKAAATQLKNNDSEIDNILIEFDESKNGVPVKLFCVNKTNGEKEILTKTL